MSNETEKITRKLRAILSADVKGYGPDLFFLMSSTYERFLIVTGFLEYHHRNQI